MQDRLARAAVPIEQTWNLDDLFASSAQWQAELTALDGARAELHLFHGRLGESAATLLGGLDAVDALQVRLFRVFSFASLRNAEDGTNPQSQADMARVYALAASMDASTAFVDSELLALPEGRVAQWLASEPGLAAHRVTLQDLLDTRPHRLHADTEETLAALGEVFGAPYMIYSRSKTNDIQFAPFRDAAGLQHANSFNAFESSYESHDDVNVRRGAWDSFSAGLHAFRNTYAATFATEVQKNVVMARLRKYESSEHYLLQPHKTPLALYRNILQIIQAELAPHFQRYARLRQRVLGLDKLLYCDIKAPLDPAFNPSVSFDEAFELVIKALEVMGPDYADYLHQAWRQRWIDRADNVGKSSGAFCATPYGVHPFILITWADSMRNVFTLAHELGHGGHFRLAMKHQRLGNTRPAMPFVEAPSIMNEMLLAQHLLASTADKRMRRAVIMQVLGTFHHNFVTHLLEAELQHRVYVQAEAGQAITAQLLCQLKGDILSAFWGDTVVIDDGACLTWMRQPHYYMGLYPYTYAVGLVASTAMAKRIRDEGALAVERWLSVLKAGGTLKPLELMQAAGIDMSTPAPIHEAVAYVGGLIDELELGFAE